MIDQMHVCDVALIHDATIEPAGGLAAASPRTAAVAWR